MRLALSADVNRTFRHRKGRLCNYVCGGDGSDRNLWRRPSLCSRVGGLVMSEIMDGSDPEVDLADELAVLDRTPFVGRITCWDVVHLVRA